MSKHTLVKEIKREIERLNDIIDMKILKGTSYKRESARHKFLMKQLSVLERRKPKTFSLFRFVSHAGRLVSTFIF